MLKNEAVSPLNGHRDSLKKIRCFQWFLGDGRSSFADLFIYFNGRLLKEPAISIAIGADMCVAVKLTNLSCYLVSAAVLVATSPPCDDVSYICESANGIHDGNVFVDKRETVVKGRFKER